MSIDIAEVTLICPKNDGEAFIIIEIAESLDMDVRVSLQPWGARLDLEPEENLKNLKKVVIIVEMPSPEKEEDLRAKGHKVIVIDHHNYVGQNLNRSHPISSLEQFACLVGQRLSRFDMGVAINDRAYIFGLLEAGYQMGEILEIRQVDLLAQGSTEEDFEKCRKALTKGKICNDVMVIGAGDFKTSYLTDLFTLADPYTVRDLLICKKNEVGFYGSPEKASKLSALGGWFGGSQKSKFWGMLNPDYKVIFSILEIDINAL